MHVLTSGRKSLLGMHIAARHVAFFACLAHCAYSVGTATYDPAAVLQFWFGGDERMNYRDKWFPRPNSSEQRNTDTFIAATFGEMLAAAEKHGLAAWEETPRDLLALIILLDQFSRHCYRNETQRWRIAQNDVLALQKADKLMRLQWDLSLRYDERIFAHMPLRHSATVEVCQHTPMLAQIWNRSIVTTFKMPVVEFDSKSVAR